MSDPSLRPRRAEGPYREALRRGARTVRDGISGHDLILLAALALCLASVSYWHLAVEAFATRVLGFPALR